MKNFRCAACGKIIQSKDNTKYCNKKCWMNKPKKVLWLEKQFKKDITKIIIDLLNHNKNITRTSEIMAIYKSDLYRYLKRYQITYNGKMWIKEG